MHAPFTRLLLVLALAAAVAPAPRVARAGDTDADTTGTIETIEVKRADTKDPKHPDLQFLKDNRVFIRAQIDRLKMLVKRTDAGEAGMLDPRYLRLKEMSAEIAAARDTVRAEGDLMSQRALLANVTDLGELVSELNLMESLLTDERHRLHAIEADFLGHQETALVVLVRGLAGKNVPASIVLTEENQSTRVDLTPEQQTSLAQGGIAQI